MLKFYLKENLVFKDAYDKKLNYDETKIVFKKITRHFKVPCHLTFGRSARGCSWGIKMPYSWSSVGVLCHEISHTIEIRKGNKGHNKKLWKTFKRLINYCRKHKFWEEEIKKRTEIKIEPEPTKEEIRNDRLEKRKKDLVRYEKKLKYYTKLYNTKIKKCKRSILMLEKNATLFQKSVGGGSVAKS